MAFFRAAICAALLLSGTVTSLAAQDVTLSSPAGAVEITGNLLGFDGAHYRVDTKFGGLTVDGSGVRGYGPGCPHRSRDRAGITPAAAALIRIQHHRLAHLGAGRPEISAEPRADIGVSHQADRGQNNNIK